MKKLLIILLLFGCGKDKEVIPECGVDEIYTEDKGCHLPTQCERLELNIYKENNRMGCLLVYLIDPYKEVEKGCITFDKYLTRTDSVFCNRIIGYGHKWTYTETCNCP